MGESLMASADKNGDGRLSFEEFMYFMHPEMEKGELPTLTADELALEASGAIITAGGGTKTGTVGSTSPGDSSAKTTPGSQGQVTRGLSLQTVETESPKRRDSLMRRMSRRARRDSFTQKMQMLSLSQLNKDDMESSSDYDDVLEGDPRRRRDTTGARRNGTGKGFSAMSREIGNNFIANGKSLAAMSKHLSSSLREQNGKRKTNRRSRRDQGQGDEINMASLANMSRILSKEVSGAKK